MSITSASITDVTELVSLINSAYRGDASKKGWTTEADLLKGELRTAVPELSALMENPDASLLKYTSVDNHIIGSVFLEKKERGLYLGMLTVSPDQQAGGIGKKLLTAAELYAQEQHCEKIFMNVISLRSELIAWYSRHGYHDTGERIPVVVDTRFGVSDQPLEFMIMEKKVTSS